MCMNAQIEHWDDIRIAFEVAKQGTLSAAAAQLNIHHSTVLRRISALEYALNTRLFHRHARGYEPTQAGNSLFQVAANINDQLNTVAGRLQSSDEQVSGKLVITTVDSFIEILTPWFAEFSLLYPSIRLEIRVDTKRLRLDHGQAHIALRPGQQPEEPDYVAQELKPLSLRLFATKSYLKRMGTPVSMNDLVNHQFVSGSSDHDSPYFSWINNHIADENIIYRASSVHATVRAVKSGIGIGLLNTWRESDEQLVSLNGDWPDWDNKLWLVTHYLMHRTARVQAFSQFIKDKISQTEI